MRFHPTGLPEILLIEPKVFTDQRGEFSKTWVSEIYKELGIVRDFVQEIVPLKPWQAPNASFSKTKSARKTLNRLARIDFQRRGRRADRHSPVWSTCRHRTCSQRCATTVGAAGTRARLLRSQ